METTCQASYPLNSENASPPGTFKAYLSWADMALPPKALTSAVTIAIVRMRWLFITSSSFVKLGAWLLESDATRRYTCRSIVPAVMSQVHGTMVAGSRSLLGGPAHNAVPPPTRPGAGPTSGKHTHGLPSH